MSKQYEVTYKQKGSNHTTVRSTKITSTSSVKARETIAKMGGGNVVYKVKWIKDN